MAKPNNQVPQVMPPSGGGGGGGEFLGLVDSAARFLATAGGLAAIVGIAFLVYNYAMLGSADNAALAQAANNIRTFGLVALLGTVALSLGLAWMFNGEETLGPLLLIGGAALYFSQIYLPMMMGEASKAESAQALKAISTSGVPPAAIGLIVVLIEVIGRVRLRTSEGSRADQLKFGKGIREERDIRNVFMGKCWQLPYCRKFVRERCPIYHARRSCWKERVGCMCEESVIRNAMEGTVIPNDIVAAAKYIPRNNKLTPDQKAERCRQCVIYNEHQKHKYKLAIPTAAVGVAAVYVLFREPMGQGIKNGLLSTDKFMKKATLQPQQGQPGNQEVQPTSIDGGVIPYHEIILVVVAFVVLAYLIKTIEYLLFKLKI